MTAIVMTILSLETCVHILAVQVIEMKLKFNSPGGELVRYPYVSCTCDILESIPRVHGRDLETCS